MDMRELSALLTKHRINLAAFGKGEAKTLEHLLREIVKGEAKLEDRDGFLFRCLRVLNIDVFYKDAAGTQWRLIEDRQEFVDGRVRRRKQLPAAVSEKMLESEDIYEAIERALEEELGVTQCAIDSSLSFTTETIESPSFPGLVTEYKLILVRVVIPTEEYRPEGYTEKQPDKSTFFKWTQAEAA